MLTQVWFKNYKGLRDIKLNLGRFNVLVGPNACGKTSVLDAIRQLSMVTYRDPSLVFNGLWDKRVLYNQTAKSNTISIGAIGEMFNNDIKSNIKVEVTIDVAAKPRPLRKDGNIDGPDGAFSVEAEINDKPLNIPKGHQINWESAAHPLVEALNSSYLRLDYFKLAEPTYSDSIIPQLEAGGFGLATVLNNMQASNPSEFSQLIEDVCSVVPIITSIRTTRVPLKITRPQTITINGQTITNEIKEDVIGHQILLDTQYAKNIPPSGISEGTLIVLGILTELHSQPYAKLLLLDDIEHGLHPKAQKNLIDLLRIILNKNSDLQIIATSHSPYLIDSLEPSEVILFDIGDEGESIAKRLIDHPDHKHWLETMTPGEFWSFAGESWVKGKQDKDK
ncbi:MAG: AAA family ATPase [Deltaproteobacteria bacterium]|nr:AAA family ATPase [Deltaproteobacteria bacterium]